MIAGLFLRYVLPALLVLGFLGGIYAKGRADGREACETRVAAAVAAEQERQRTAANAALEDARQTAVARQIENAALQDKVDAYEAELSSRPAVAACAASDADIGRLRDLLR